MHPVPPAESKAYGFRIVTADELATMLASSRLKPNQRRYVADVLFYELDSLDNPSPSGVFGFRAALYRDYNSGAYTLAFQYNLRDDCAELFRTVPTQHFERLANDCAVPNRWPDDPSGPFAAIGCPMSGWARLLDFDSPLVEICPTGCGTCGEANCPTACGTICCSAVRADVPIQPKHLLVDVQGRTNAGRSDPPFDVGEQLGILFVRIRRYLTRFSHRLARHRLP